MGLLDFFRRKGGVDRSSGSAPPAEGPADLGEREPDASAGPPGFAAEGPPVGASDAGALSGDDADDVAGRETG